MLSWATPDFQFGFEFQLQLAGFPFHFFERGGNGPPPPEGGIRAPRGGMARDAIATINFDRNLKIFIVNQITVA